MDNFLDGARGFIKNPLGIIALFVSLIYGIACLVLSISMSNLKTTEERLPMIWFVVIFPIIILAAFVFLVTNHHGKLYSPSDYGSADSFLQTLGATKFEAVKINANNDNSVSGKIVPVDDDEGIVILDIPSDNLVAKAEDANLNRGRFSDSTRDNVKLANEVFKLFTNYTNSTKYHEFLLDYSFSAQAPEYFILEWVYKRIYVKKNYDNEFLVLIRVTRDENGVLNVIAIGKGIIETDVNEFAKKIFSSFIEFSSAVLKLQSAISDEKDNS